MTEMVSSTTHWRDERDQPQARVLLDSISDGPNPVRLTTIEVTLHRFVLAELNTHRTLSRNSASSRAIPFTKQVDKVTEHPAIPVEWRQRQSGMQGGDLLDSEAAKRAKQSWLLARDRAVEEARYLHGQGVHKSIVNRILEPFLWHNVIITATEWQGFWAQRCSPLAQPEIRVAAEAMKDAYDASEPTELDHGQWHTPLIQPDEDRDFWETFAYDTGKTDGSGDGVRALALEMRKRVSAARCARVSYLTHDGERDIQKDLDLFERLSTASPPHASPFEHVATPFFDGSTHRDTPHAGNLVGWSQFRHELWPSAYTTAGATT